MKGLHKNPIKYFPHILDNSPFKTTLVCDQSQVDIFPRFIYLIMYINLFYLTDQGDSWGQTTGEIPSNTDAEIANPLAANNEHIHASLQT